MMTEGVVFMGERMFSIMANPGNLHLYMSYDENSILGFQGAVVEHQQHVEKLGHESVVVRYSQQLDDLNGIILPGGESTTMGKLLCSTGMMEPLKNKIQAGLPVWGTCAGMILLAKELVNDPVRHLGVMQ